MGKDTETDRKTVGEWLKDPCEWRIPVYQRHYAWSVDKDPSPVHLFWETVKEQAKSRLKKENPDPHYLGTVLVDNKTNPQSTDVVKRYDVVDGQQRLTTIQIALLALVQVAKDNKYGSEIMEELNKYVFIGENTKKPDQPKLKPSNFDGPMFEWVLNNTYGVRMDFSGENIDKKNAEKSRIASTYLFFKNEYGEFVSERKKLSEQAELKFNSKDVISAIMNTLLEGVDFVLVVLRRTDDARSVFESLNNYGEQLTTFDLIRNNLFHCAALIETGLDEKLFKTSDWQYLEGDYWGEDADNKKTDRRTHIETYIALLLMAKTKEYIFLQRNVIFNKYKEFYKEFYNKKLIKEVIPDLVQYTKTYRYLDSDKEESPLNSFKGDFGVFHYKHWKNRHFYPVIFSIVESKISDEEKMRMIKLLESYVIRRGICNLPTKGYNKNVVDICKMVNNNPNYEGFSKALKDDKTSETNLFPDDERVLRDCINAKFYKSPFQRYVFEEIEESMNDPRAERVSVKEGVLTIDHILPQGWNGEKEWRRIVLGEENERNSSAELMVGTYIDTIGNLTLLSDKNNSIKSNRPLDAVKELLIEATVKLNRELAGEKEWNVEKIVARSKKLGGEVCEIWPYDIK